MQADVAVAEDEPVGAAQLADDAHRRAGVVAHAPAQLADAAGQRVEHGVDVGRDVQIPVLEVVADVRDHGHGGLRLGREHAEREPRTADAAGEDGHPHAGSMPRMAIAIDTTTPFGERAARRLRDEPLAWLVTVSPAGQPQPSPIWFEWDGSSILLYSKPDTPKLRNIAANPRVTLHLDGNGHGGDIVIVSGTAAAQRRPARRPGAELRREVRVLHRSQRLDARRVRRRLLGRAAHRTDAPARLVAPADGACGHVADRPRSSDHAGWTPSGSEGDVPLMSTTVPAPEKTGVRTLRNYVGGRWVDSSSSDYLDITNPATGDVLARVPLSSKEELDDAARTAQGGLRRPGARCR